MEGFNPNDPQELRKAALKVKEQFFGSDAPPRTYEKKHEPPAPNDTRQVLVNAPIDFELQTLDPDHPYLKERGFTDETIRHFGLGFCNRGMLKSRIAIPLHDAHGRRVGYAGRLTRDEDISETNPKYRFPGERERNGAILEVRKSLLLYNGHRLKRKGAGVVIVEGFPSVWWLHQHGYKDVVALMGSDCSEAQVKLLLERVDFDGRIWIMTDGDKAGHDCAISCFCHLAPYRFTRWVQLKDGEQPTDCNAEDLEAMLNT